MTHPAQPGSPRLSADPHCGTTCLPDTKHVSSARELTWSAPSPPLVSLTQPLPQRVTALFSSTDPRFPNPAVNKRGRYKLGEEGRGGKQETESVCASLSAVLVTGRPQNSSPSEPWAQLLCSPCWPQHGMVRAKPGLHEQEVSLQGQWSCTSPVTPLWASIYLLRPRLLVCGVRFGETMKRKGGERMCGSSSVGKGCGVYSLGGASKQEQGCVCRTAVALLS